MANSADPDQTLHSAASHTDQHCLLRPVCPNIQGYYINITQAVYFFENSKTHHIAVSKLLFETFVIYLFESIQSVRSYPPTSDFDNCFISECSAMSVIPLWYMEHNFSAAAIQTLYLPRGLKRMHNHYISRSKTAKCDS